MNGLKPQRRTVDVYTLIHVQIGKLKLCRTVLGKEFGNCSQTIWNVFFTIFLSWKMHKKNMTTLLKRFRQWVSWEVLYLEQLAVGVTTSPEIVSNSSKNIWKAEYSRPWNHKKAIRELLHGIKDKPQSWPEHRLGFKSRNYQKSWRCCKKV